MRAALAIAFPVAAFYRSLCHLEHLVLVPRYQLLVIGQSGYPLAVVKAGSSPAVAESRSRQASHTLAV
jgi:hypothetical protein